MSVKRDFTLKGSLCGSRCPMDENTFIGSNGCQKCSYFSEIHWRNEEEDRTYVRCNFDTENEKLLGRADVVYKSENINITTREEVEDFIKNPKIKFDGFIGKNGFEYAPIFLEDTVECINRIAELYDGKFGIDYGRKPPVFKFYSKDNVEYKKDGRCVTRKCGYITGKLGDYCIFSEQKDWVYIVNDLFKDGKYAIIK